MTDDKPTMWNGGTTKKKKKKAIREWNRLLRASEDFYDLDDSEREFRKDLQKREKLMKEQDQKNPIQSKYSLSNPRINKDMDKPATISGGAERNKYRKPEGSKL